MQETLEARTALTGAGVSTANLVVMAPGIGDIVALGERAVTVGADPSNEVYLPGCLCEHLCTIAPTHEGRHRLLALEAYRELRLNGRVVREAKLLPYDRIRVGSCDMVYLPAGVDAKRVGELLSEPDGATRRLERAEVDTVELRERLLWLLLMTQSIPPGAEVTPVLELIMQEMIRWTDYDHVSLLLHRGGLRLDLSMSYPTEPPGIAEHELEACEDLARQVLDGEVYTGCSPFAAFPSVLCLPLRNIWTTQERRRSPIGSVEGLLVLGCQRAEAPAPSEEVLSLLHALTRQVATLLGNVRVFRQATRDPLTGLASRACAERVLEDEVQLARDASTPLALLIFDVDDFKRINDTWGHLAGDQALEQLGARLRAELRCDDFACRWGGEEFLVLLPGTDLAGARTVAENLVRRVSSAPTLPPSRPGVTVSAGVAVFPLHGDDASEVVGRADEALYEAKRAGKACFRVYTPPLDEETESWRAPEYAPEAQEGQLFLQHPLLDAVLIQGKLVLGRSARSDVRLAHPQVSRRHGLVEVQLDGRVMFRDISSNGSLLNGKPVKHSELRAGDVLTLGPYELQVVGELPSKDTPRQRTLSALERDCSLHE